MKALQTGLRVKGMHSKMKGVKGRGVWQIHIPFLVFGVCVFASFWRLSCGFGFLGSKLSSPRCRHSFRLCICVCGCAYICVCLCGCVCASKLQLQALCSCSWTLLWLHILQNSLRSSTAVALTTLTGSVAAGRGVQRRVLGLRVESSMGSVLLAWALTSQMQIEAN